MTTNMVKDQSAQLSTGRQAWLLAKSLTKDARRVVGWLAPRRRERNLVVGLTLYVLASNRWPWPTFVASIVGVYVAWRTTPGEWLRLRWSLRGDAKYDAFMRGLFEMAGAKVPPTIMRDAKGKAMVSIGPRSWTFQMLAPQGGDGQTAHELCKLWPKVKNEIGVGCIAVNTHERTGNHFTVVVVWQRMAGERVVRIRKDLSIIVHAERPFSSYVWNPSLDGWVRSDMHNASEYHGPDDPLILPQLDPRDAKYGDDPDEQDPVEEVEDDAEDEAGEDFDQPHDEPESEPTWTPEPVVMARQEPIYRSGVGDRDATTPPVVDPPPSPFLAPPSGPPVSANLFAPTTPAARFRPTGAAPGTATGNLWDAVQAGPERTTRELAELVGMTPGSAGNALSRWRKLGFIDGENGRWLAHQGIVATVAPDGDQETA